MAKKKANPRIKIGSNNEMILYDQVDGICPLCAKPLMYDKTKKEKVFEIAHIYPLNPTPSELVLLKDEEVLSTDLNHIDNLILLCPTCHTKFDKPRTVAEYKKLLALKKRLIHKNKVYGQFNAYKIEEEINVVLEMLVSEVPSDLEENKLKYDALRVSEKADNTLTALTRRDIENDVVDYYITIKQRFVDLNKSRTGSFDLLSSQVKTFYTELKVSGISQEDIFDGIIEWFNKKTNNHSRPACRIIASFFVQNCEVLS
ncbi:MAG: ABC-three component system protein [Candidatus Pristimantibacillus sp.]